ncbi:uncharacterized protein LOC143301985 [Babylonia areolata]|uniref:uncharacterized protein LOC143301985 n=1 Tax=Babylonia areolata TaxID=304850 RepID=UPI003FD3E15C
MGRKRQQDTQSGPGNKSKGKRKMKRQKDPELEEIMAINQKSLKPMKKKKNGLLKPTQTKKQKPAPTKLKEVITPPSPDDSDDMSGDEALADEFPEAEVGQSSDYPIVGEEVEGGDEFNDSEVDEEEEESDDDDDNDDEDGDDNDDDDDDEEEEEEEEGGSSDDSDADESELLPIEKAAKKQQKKSKKDSQLAEDELQTNIAATEKFVLPSGQEIEKDAHLSADLTIVHQRIKDVQFVLADFKGRRQQDRSRQDYIVQLRRDLCLYYSYNEFLMEKLMELFPQDITDYLEANEVPRPITIRTNTLKTRRRDLAQALISRGVNLDPIGPWSKVGLVISESQVPIGATPEYLAGHYMLQGGSSFLPVMALAPQEKERVLDMCSAPGGKSSYIAALMKNTGSLFSNDANPERAKAIVSNLHRMGVHNAVISSYDGRVFPKIMHGFDRVLLDAPCSGTGVVAKDASIKLAKDEKDIQRCSHLQKELILAAIDCCTTGGFVVYSTCSVLVEENEWVVQYALNMRNVRLMPTGLSFGVEGFTNFQQHRFHPAMKLARRFYPHTHNLDGFFVAKLQKMAQNKPTEENQNQQKDTKKNNQQPKKSTKKPKGDSQDKAATTTTTPPAKVGQKRKGEEGRGGPKLKKAKKSQQSQGNANRKMASSSKESQGNAAEGKTVSPSAAKKQQQQMKKKKEKAKKGGQK